MTIFIFGLTIHLVLLCGRCFFFSVGPPNFCKGTEALEEVTSLVRPKYISTISGLAALNVSSSPHIDPESNGHSAS